LSIITAPGAVETKRAAFASLRADETRGASASDCRKISDADARGAAEAEVPGASSSSLELP
jgi:hypothetical protein